jgi:hypothetical protein
LPTLFICKKQTYATIWRIVTVFLQKKEMKRTIVTIDIDDVLTLIRRNDGKAIVPMQISVDGKADGSVDELCTRLDRELVQKNHLGDVILRVTSPAGFEITMTEVAAILDILIKHGIENCIWGADSDDATDELTIDLIYTL